MFFVEKPYVSDFFKRTVRDHALPVVGTDIAREMGLYDGTPVISEARAIEMARAPEPPAIYTTSENAIGWIATHLGFSDLPGKIALFKDKLKFRELTKSLFPEVHFRAVRAGDLKSIPVDQLAFPFVIKPTVGFFSMGVHRVSDADEWRRTIDVITSEIEQIRTLYPMEVLDTASFIMEQCIDGEELAVDAYYNAAGEPVVLNILKHLFSSDADVRDRVYMTSGEIIRRNLEDVMGFAEKIGRLADVKNFPVHIELRRNAGGRLLPIEVNPMRFGGWCTTPDLAFMAYGINPYVYYASQRKPEWHELLKGKEGRVFSMIVLENSTGIGAEEIASFDYEKLLSKFSSPMELRKIDYRQYPVFGFLFVETGEAAYAEIRDILDSDLTEFISKK